MTGRIGPSTTAAGTTEAAGATEGQDAWPERQDAWPERQPERQALGQRIRASRALSPAQRRYWLAVLPHLRPADRQRLDAILRAGAG